MTEQWTAENIEKLRERYRIERDKRIRPDGNRQFKELAGQYEEFDRDPYTERVEREPVVCETEVVVVGGGFGGMLTAIELTKLGITDFRLVEKGGDFGGTWYWNRYPGCMCDVESYTYLPLLEETGYMPTERYASGAGDLRVLPAARPPLRPLRPRLVPDRHHWGYLGRRDGSLAGARLTGATSSALASWSSPAASCTRRSCRASRASRRSRARPSTPAGGITPTPAAPRRRRWTELADKRVGIIGTGATAVQAVPQLAESARELYVFQRTPSAVGVRNQAPTDVELVQEPAGRVAARAHHQLHPVRHRCAAGAEPRRRRLDRGDVGQHPAA